MESTTPIIIDNGSATTKVGFAGERSPSHVFRTVIGRPRFNKVDFKSYYSGDEAFSGLGQLALRYPVDRKQITSLADIEHIWNHTFYDVLKVAPEEYPVGIALSAYDSKKTFTKTTEIMMETFCVPSLLVADQAVLALYHAEKSTGMVLDLGDSGTSISIITDGRLVKYASPSYGVGGRDVTEHMQKILVEKGYSFPSVAEREIVRDMMKEKHCYVTLDYQSDAMKSSKTNQLDRQYNTNEGRLVTINNERFRAPEVIFDRSLLLGSECSGLVESICHAIANIQPQYRDLYWSNMVLCGGCSLLPNLAERLKLDLTRLNERYNYPAVNTNITVKEDRLYSTWIGGSMFAQSEASTQYWITQAEYGEYGSAIIAQKSFDWTPLIHE